jgi:hypothetical protein
VIGISPWITFPQWTKFLLDQGGRIWLTSIESEQIWSFALEYEIDPAFLLGAWGALGGLPLGATQRDTHNPLNLRAPAGETRPTRNGLYWYESFKIGMHTAILELKNRYGAFGTLGVRGIIGQIVPAAEAEARAREVLQIMQSARAL